MNFPVSQTANPCKTCSASFEEVKGSGARFRKQLGRVLGEGGNKVAFQYGSGAIAVLKILQRDVIVAEMGMLSTLANNNLPTPAVTGPLHIEGFAQNNLTSIGERCRPAIEYKECFAHGSKQVISVKKGKVAASQQALSIGQGSLPKLRKIRTRLVTQKIRINDLQFLVRTDGSVVIADPIEVCIGKKPSQTNLRIIDKLIQLAQAQL